LLDRKGRLKVADFGLAVTLGASRRSLELAARSQLGQLFGYLRAEAQKSELHEVEREIFGKLLALGLTLLKYFLAKKGFRSFRLGASTATCKPSTGSTTMPMHDSNKRNLLYFSNASMRGLYDTMETWQAVNEKRLLSLSIERDDGMFCCIALTNPTEVVICDGIDAYVSSGALHVRVQ